ncbi:hypothetical protein [Aeromonas hydrophila]|uniref:hypothetical protein n=1 Tax=Aeromonas hydrophila TaxID=644 RepID=UPI002B45CC6C|nr:hypothetical protein [Aeromonas hydrophila]
MAKQEEDEWGIYYIKGPSGRSLSEALSTKDVSRCAFGLTIEEWGLEHVVFVMNDNAREMMRCNDLGRLVYWDGHRQWSLEEMQKRLEPSSEIKGKTMRSYKIEPSNGRNGLVVILLDGDSEVRRVPFYFEEQSEDDGDVTARADAIRECENIGNNWVADGKDPLPVSLILS